MNSKNDFSASAEYYDLILGRDEYVKNSRFIGSILKKHTVKSVLELASGSGLYLFPLKKMKFDIEGLDISKEMLDAAKKQDSKIKLYLADMSKFKINKSYDAIILLNSGLVLLPSFDLIQKTIIRVGQHLKNGGLFIIDIPNHNVEIKESNNTQSYEKYNTKEGQLDVIFKSYKKGNYWIEEWHGHVRNGKKLEQFKEYFKELIISQKKLEQCLKDNGFKTIEIYGSRIGGKFLPEKSYRKVYVCRRV